MPDSLARSLKSFAVLLLFLGAGEAVVYLLQLPLPGSVVGMVLLAACLIAGAVGIEQVERAADLLLSQLSLLFVPPAVAIMMFFDLLLADWLPLVVGTAGGLLAVVWATGLSAQRLMRKQNDEHG